MGKKQRENTGRQYRDSRLRQYLVMAARIPIIAKQRKRNAINKSSSGKQAILCKPRLTPSRRLHLLLRSMGLPNPAHSPMTDYSHPPSSQRLPYQPGSRRHQTHGTYGRHGIRGGAEKLGENPQKLGACLGCPLVSGRLPQAPPNAPQPPTAWAQWLWSRAITFTTTTTTTTPNLGCSVRRAGIGHGAF